MSDNTQINSGTGGDLIATDDIGGVKHQRVKIEYGADGTALDVTDTNRLPVEVLFSNGILDSFARLRTSNPISIFESKQIANNQPLFWSEKLAGGGSTSWLVNLAATRMSVGTASGDQVIRQTKRYFGYQTGKSHLVMFTGTMGAIKANVRQRMGYFDVDNGLFFEQNGSNLGIVRRTFVTGSSVDTFIPQSSWNLDKLNGSGASGLTLDMTKAQIFVIDFQWLGAGRVRFGFSINGKINYCHELLNANSLSEVFMSTPDLPIRFELTNTNTTASPTSMDVICSTVISEGWESIITGSRAVDRGISGIAIGVTLLPVISIRLANYKKISIQNLSANLITSTTANFRYALLINPTITGGTTASWQSVTNSGVEFDIARDGAVTGGTLLASGYVVDNLGFAEVDIEQVPTLGADIDGNLDQLVLAAQSLAGNNTYFGAIRWREHS